LADGTSETVEWVLLRTAGAWLGTFGKEAFACGSGGSRAREHRGDIHGRARRPSPRSSYVIPERRGRGLGRALLEAALDHARKRGAARIDLNTSVSDVAARALYESAGFTNGEGGSEGPTMLYYERDV
jgi:GNAT superfamily N-acetyltransferase